MDTSKRSVGRPKTAVRTGPLVLDEDRKRAEVTLEIGTGTARELAEYSTWVEQASGMASADATFTTVDYALREIFRRDRVWQDRRRTSTKAEAKSAEVKPAMPAAAVRPPSPSSALPPPSTRGLSEPRDPRDPRLTSL